MRGRHYFFPAKLRVSVKNLRAEAFGRFRGSEVFKDGVMLVSISHLLGFDHSRLTLVLMLCPSVDFSEISWYCGPPHYWSGFCTIVVNYRIRRCYICNIFQALKLNFMVFCSKLKMFFVSMWTVLNGALWASPLHLLPVYKNEARMFRIWALPSRGRYWTVNHTTVHLLWHNHVWIYLTCTGCSVQPMSYIIILRGGHDILAPLFFVFSVYKVYKIQCLSLVLTL